MPYWCLQRVIVRHDDPKMMQRLSDAYRREEVCQEFLPMPAEYANDEETYESWAHYHWGTPMDFGEGRNGKPLAVRGDSIDLRFDTVWWSPFPMFLRLHELGFDLHAYIYDPLGEVCLSIHGRKTKVFTFKCLRPECIRKHVDLELLEMLEDFLECQGIDNAERACFHEPWFKCMDIKEYIATFSDYTPHTVRKFDPNH